MNSDSINCPFCGRDDRQVKAGMHNNIQRYKCMYCSRRYIPSQHRGYPDDIRKQAIDLYIGGMKIRQIGRQLNLNPSSVGNWIRTAKIQPPQNSSAPDIDGHIQAHNSVHVNRLKRAGVIGIVIHHYISMEVTYQDNIGPVLLSGINSKAEMLGYDLRIYTGWPNRRRFFGDEFLDTQIDGLIWVGPELNTSEIFDVCETGLPVVALLSHIVPDNAGYVIVDNVGGVKKLISHLVDIGHRRIAYIGPTNTSDFLDRIEGYKQGLADHDIPLDPDLLVANDAVSSNWVTTNMKDYEETLFWWLSFADKPTAIVLANDGLAIWTMNFLRTRSIRVPEDIAITGFDDLPCSQPSSGDLTTVRQPFREIGIMAVDRLVALIEGELADKCKIRLPARIMVRGSTVSAGLSTI